MGSGEGGEREEVVSEEREFDAVEAELFDHAPPVPPSLSVDEDSSARVEENDQVGGTGDGDRAKEDGEGDGGEGFGDQEEKGGIFEDATG